MLHWIRIKPVVTGVRYQAEESVTRTLELDSVRQRYEATYSDSATTADQLACWLFEQPYVTARTVGERFDVARSTAHRAIQELQEEGVLAEVTGQQRNREYRAKEIFEILERPPETY